jgi:hypothetical protein
MLFQNKSEQNVMNMYDEVPNSYENAPIMMPLIMAQLFCPPDAILCFISHICKVVW